MKSAKYLLKLQEMKKLNDTELAKLLKLTQPAISNYKASKRIMDDETCLAIALELDINPMEIIGAACIDRAEKTGQKSLWEVFTMRTAQQSSAVLTLCFVTSFLTPTPSEAANMRVSGSAELTTYKLCEIIRRIRRWQQVLQSTVNRTKLAFAKLTLFNSSALQTTTT